MAELVDLPVGVLLKAANVPLKNLSQNFSNIARDDSNFLAYLDATLDSPRESTFYDFHDSEEPLQNTIRNNIQTYIASSNPDHPEKISRALLLLRSISDKKTLMAVCDGAAPLPQHDKRYGIYRAYALGMLPPQDITPARYDPLNAERAQMQPGAARDKTASNLAFTRKQWTQGLPPTTRVKRAAELLMNKLSPNPNKDTERNKIKLKYIQRGGR